MSNLTNLQVSSVIIGPWLTLVLHVVALKARALVPSHMVLLLELSHLVAVRSSFEEFDSVHGIDTTAGVGTNES